MNNGEEKIIDYSYKNFKGENIKLLKPKKKTYLDNQGKDGSYNEVPILCSHGPPESLYTGRGWMVEYCPVWSDGLRAEEKEYTNKDDKGNIVKKTVSTYQVKITFDRREEDHMKLVNKLDEGHLAIAKKLIEKEFLVELNVRGLCVDANEIFDANERVNETGLRRLVHYPLDDKGKIMEGVGLSQFIRLRGTPKNDNHTTFIDLKGREIPWEELTKCDFFWAPLVLYTHIYSSGNGKLSVQRKVESGIVIKRRPRGGAEKQNNTLKRFQNIYSAEMNKLPSQDYTSKENGNSISINESKEEEEKIHQPAPLNKLQEMASGFQNDVQGKPITNTVQVPLIPQASQNTAPQYNQPTAAPQNNIQAPVIPQNNAQQYIQTTTIPQNNIQAPVIPQNNSQQYIQNPTIPQNSAPQYNQPTIIPQNNVQPSLIPQNVASQYNQPAFIPGAMVGVPSVGIPQINQQSQTFQG